MVFFPLRQATAPHVRGDASSMPHLLTPLSALSLLSAALRARARRGEKRAHRLQPPDGALNAFGVCGQQPQQQQPQQQQPQQQQHAPDGALNVRMTCRRPAGR